MCFSSSLLIAIKYPDLSNLTGKGLFWLTVPRAMPSTDGKA